MKIPDKHKRNLKCFLAHTFIFISLAMLMTAIEHYIAQVASENKLVVFLLATRIQHYLAEKITTF